MRWSERTVQGMALRAVMEPGHLFLGSNGLFSTPEPQAAREAFAEQQPPSVSGVNPNAGGS
jgi:hypothetical protein